MITADQARELTSVREPELLERQKRFEDDIFETVMKDIENSARSGHRVVSISRFEHSVGENWYKRFTDLGFDISPMRSTCGGVTTNYEKGWITW